MRLISPFLFIRFGTIRSDRIGHFVLDSAELIGRNLAEKGKTYDFYWLPNTLSNKEWKKLISNSFNISYIIKFLQIANNNIPGGHKHNILPTLYQSRDFEGLFYKYKCFFKFGASQHKQGLYFLKSIGWDKNDKIICLNIRDKSYLNSFESKTDWSYHDYRNSNSDNFLESIKWLISEGFKVIRIGSVAEKEIKLKHPSFFDYPFYSRKTPFLDIWIPTICTACISTGSGLDAIAQIYRKPILYVNILPLQDFNFFNNSTMAPKICFWKKNKKNLTASEYMKYSYYKKNQYTKLGIVIKELNKEDILGITKDYFLNTIPKKNILDKQKKFIKLYFNWLDTIYNNNNNNKFWKHPNSKISNYWLMKFGKNF